MTGIYFRDLLILIVILECLIGIDSGIINLLINE